MTDSDEIDELREQTRGTDRISADAGNGTEGGAGGQKEEKEKEEYETKAEEDAGDEGEATDTPTPSEAFEDVFEERARRAESGIDPRSVSATDPALSALLLAAQDADELDEIGDAVADALGAPAPPEYDRDAVVRLAVAYALNETAPGYFEVLAEHV
ncbi:MAG: hypothetical protein U5J64_00790 [Halobacteriales archaeon]|nr:hypothetical protein [Halobacteriales archaeon]